MSSSTPNAIALISLLWPKNLGVLVRYLQHNGPRIIITSRGFLGADHLATLKEHGATTVIIEDILSTERRFSIKHYLAQLAHELQETLKNNSLDGRLENEVRHQTAAQATKHLPTTLETITALDELAAEFPLELMLVNEDWMPFSRCCVQWAKQKGLPSLHLEHNPFLNFPSTIHSLQHSDHMAIFGHLSREVFALAGYDLARLHSTGLPQFDQLIAEHDNRLHWRDFICSRHGLDSARPIVVYGTTWFAGLSFLEDSDNPECVLSAYFKAIKTLGNKAQHIIKDRPGATGESQVRATGRRHGVPDRDYVYVTDALDAGGVPMEKPLPYLLGADLIVANESGLLVEALCVGTRAVNLITNTGTFIYGPSYPGDCGIRQAVTDNLPEIILRTLADPDIPAQMAAAAPKINAGQDGRAIERVVNLMQAIALRQPAKIPYIPDTPLKNKRTPPVWKSLLEVESIDATGYHGGVRKELVDLSERPIRCALDIGCAAGGTGAYIKARHKNARVIGIEVNRAAAKIAEQRLDQVLVGKFEDIDFAAAGIRRGSIDTVIVADVLEHLYDPWSVLTRLQPWLSMDAQIIASIPNVRNLKLMEDMAAGYWRYEDSGLLDITHIRFFTLREIRRFFHETGYHVRTLKYAIDPRLMDFFQQHRDRDTAIDINLGKMSMHGIEGQELDELCSLQFYIVAGLNARTDDMELYRATPPDQQLLEWLAPTPQEGRLWEEHLATWDNLPKIQLFLIDTVGDSTRISASIANLARQLYPSLSLTIISPEPAPEGIGASGRLGWFQRAPDTPAFECINQQLHQSAADWVGTLFAGDIAEPAAFLRLMELAHRHPTAACLYGDDGTLQQNIAGHFCLKPDFDLNLLLGWDYLSSGLILIRREWLVAHQGFTANRRGAELFDAALRLHAQQGNPAFLHLAQPVVHRPPHGNDGDLPLAQVVQARREAIADYLRLSNDPALVEDGWTPGTFRLRRPLPVEPLISLLIVADDQTPEIQFNLEKLLSRTDYPRYEILILDNGVTDSACLEFLAGLDAMKTDAIRVFKLDPPTSPVQAINLLAEQANGNLLVLLDASLSPATANWLRELAGLAAGSGIGAVAPRILGTDGRITRSGLLAGINQGVADAFHGLAHHQSGIMGRAHLTQRFSALPQGCLLLHREVFEAAGGLDTENTPDTAQAIADLTLRLSAAGFTCLWTPFVSLLETAGSDSPASALPLNEALLVRHLPLLKQDPAYHPALGSTLPVFSYEKRRELITERFPWRPLPRILAFHADTGGCGYYRIIEPAKALSAAYQAQAESTCFISGSVEIARINPDYLILQRQINDDQIERLDRMRRINKVPLCYELDDLMFDLPKDSPHRQEIPKDIEARLRRGIALCDRLIVSTGPLADALRSMNQDIRVVPNYLPGSRWLDLLPQRRQGKKPRVGWSGSVSHVGDLLIITEIVRELANEVDWVFMGLAPDALRPYIAEFHPGLPFDEYPTALATLDLDLALAPLELCRFNECKSNLKLMEYGILGYPVIATDITPYQCGLPVTLVKNKRTHWIRAIREHLSDRDELARRGDALRAAVRKDWMLEDHLTPWFQAWTGS